MSAVRIGLVVIGVLAVVTVGLWIVQRRLIYLPSGTAGDPPAGWDSVTVSTGDGLQLTGWHASAGTEAPVVVVFPGNAGNRSGRVPLGDALVEQGFAVLLVEYRGYGGNPGAPSEEGLAEDARAYVSWVRNAHPDADVVYLGESLGAAVAARAATENPPDAVVLRSPFTSLPDAARVHFPFLPVGMLLHDEFPVIDQVAELPSPVSVVAGTADGTIPLSQSRAVFDAARMPNTWVTVEEADHNDPELAHGPAVVSTVVASLD